MNRRQIPKILQWRNQEIYEQGFIFRTHGGTWISAKHGGQVSRVFDDITASDPNFSNAKCQIVEKCQNIDEHFPNSELEYLYTDMDQPSTLGPLATTDNRIYRTKYQCRKPEAEDLEIARWLIRRIIKHARLEDIVHREVSSSGAPYFIKGASYKKLMLKKWYSSKEQFHLLSTIIQSKDLDSMTNNGIYPFFTKGERKHFVKRGKQREYITPELAEKGEIKFESVDFTHPSDSRLHCYDRRFMYAAPVAPNLGNQILNNALMSGFKDSCYFARYNGPEELSNEIKSLGGDRELFSLDKQKFGETFCAEVVQVIFDELQDSKFGTLANNARAMLAWPGLYTNVRRGSYDIFWTYDPSKGLQDYENHVFFSGHGLVAFLGQFLGSLDAILMIKSQLQIEVDLDKLAEGFYNNLIWFKNKGDDTIFSISGRLKLKFSTSKSLHADVVEKETVFLGFYYNNMGDILVSAGKFLANTLLPERDVSNKSFPKLGHRLRIELYRQYGGNKIDEALLVMREALLKNCRFDFIKWCESIDISTKKMESKIKTAEDALFISNPDVINYKLDKTLVSDELIRHFYQVSEPEEYKGVVDE